MFDEVENTSRTSPQQDSSDSSAPSDLMLQVSEEKNGFPIDECQEGSELILNIQPSRFYNEQEFEEEPTLQSLFLPSIIVVSLSATSLPPSSILHRTMSFDEEANEWAAVVAKRNLSISSQDDSFFVLEEDDDN
jgi:hypothetical protein